ncbi:MAG: hypothetical protein WCY27_03555 [archaeon]|nr:GNAT family N-acetyltransferase [archaeon]MDD2477701.1 hypothetical protein [Candidatus ainarchaeum sp.]MDD3084554.1 hypothetical protein [Candidatus ainarchaeum sp.]MDD4221278.1 hypothetical protein [Candidatus ainarchaeum sp.]MDD4662789.1 hypothetical protein [Candidatus ainarchaeum sp.]
MVSKDPLTYKVYNFESVIDEKLVKDFINVYSYFNASNPTISSINDLTSFLQKKLRSKNYRLFIAYKDNVSCAFLEGKLKDNSSFHIDLFKVKEDSKNKKNNYRNQKIGKKLFFHAVSYLSSKENISHFPISSVVLDPKVYGIREDFIKRKNTSKRISYTSKKYSISAIRKKLK